MGIIRGIEDGDIVIVHDTQRGEIRLEQPAQKEDES